MSESGPSSESPPASATSSPADNDGGVSADHAQPGTQTIRVAPVVAGSAETNTVRADVLPVACWRLNDLRFEFNSSFLRPEAAAEMHKLHTLREEHPDAPLSIFGHADPVGNDDYNKALSGRRARAVYALLVRDIDMWNALFDDAADNWGTLAVQHMLRALGHDPGSTSGVLDEPTQAAIAAFQEANGLTNDGIAGPLTRARLMPAYMDVLCADAQGMPYTLTPQDFLAGGADAEGKGDYQGCSEFNPLLMFSSAEDTELSQPANHHRRNFENGVNRRVMILLFRPGSRVDPARWPCPRSSAGVTECRQRFWSDAGTRRQFQSDRRRFEDTRDTFACRFYHRLATTSPCERVTPVVPPLPVQISLVRIETTDASAASGFHADDDFSPRLAEIAKVHVQLANLPVGFSGKLRIDFGRLTNRPNNAATADVNESLTLVSRVEVNVAAGADPLPLEVDWDGLATVDVPQAFSNRQTPDVNNANNVNVPMQAITSGNPVLHGLYAIDQVTLLQGATEVTRLRPVGVNLSVPHLANLSFNANWPTDLSRFGLTPFRTQLEEALRRFGGRDYQIRNATLTNRANVRFITNAGITNAQSIRVVVGGSNPARPTLFGSTPVNVGNNPTTTDNMFAFHDGLGSDINVFPSVFMLFNVDPNAGEQTAFRNAFGPVGVAVGSNSPSPPAANARVVAADGSVTGGCTADDFTNVTVVLNADGLATVTSTNPAIVPVARATNIQRALRAFVRMVGNTINHELAHGLGVAAPIDPGNQITIAGTTVATPLNGDNGAHNRTHNLSNIVDPGAARPFVRRIESTNVQNRFNAVNIQYLRDCVPFDDNDD